MVLWAMLCATSIWTFAVVRAHADPAGTTSELAYALEGTAWRPPPIGKPAPESTVPGATLPAFRVKATIATDARALFDLFMNTDGIETWAYGVSEAQLVKQLAEGAELLYLYSDTPWPVRDRDMVVVRVSEVSPDGQTFRVIWHCVSDSAVPKRKNVVRVSSCESEFLLRRLDAGSTALDYRVSIDPSGALPEWARKWFARKAPGETLASIVQRVKQMQKPSAPTP